MQRQSIMSNATTVGQGFLATATVIMLFLTLAWFSYFLNPLAGVACFLILAVPFSLRIIKARKNFRANELAETRVKQAKHVLMGLQGFGFACWFYDVLSTVFVINIQQSGTELNVLGWPTSALGALAFYVPMAFVAYYLLYRQKTKESFYATLAVTALVVFMGLLNFGASMINLSFGQFQGTVEDFEVLAITISVVLTFTVLNIFALVRKKKYIPL